MSSLRQLRLSCSKTREQHPAYSTFPDDLPWRHPYVNIGEFWSAAGVAGQYAFDGPPYVGGYRLLPRFAADVSNAPIWLPVTGGG